jgi:chromosome segregation ATPase
MLLRLSLIVAILAGVATLYFGHVKVQEKLTTLTDDLSQAQNARTKAEEAQRKADKESKQAKADLAQANKDLAEKVATLETTTAKLAEQEKRANQASEELTKVTGERNRAQEELSMWAALGQTPEQIKAFKDQIAKINSERDAYADENKILLRQNSELDYKLSRYEGPEKEIKMRHGLTGKVLAVDPKYDFVVLDVGGNQGVVENGHFLVNRGGKLVAKLRVTKVEPNRSIANVLPDWRQTEVIEGDQVVY